MQGEPIISSGYKKFRIGAQQEREEWKAMARQERMIRQKGLEICGALQSVNNGVE